MPNFSEFTKNNLILLFSVAAAIAAGALAYDAFIWAGELAAILSALANIIVIGGVRVVSVSTLFERFLHHFDADQSFRQICLQQLNALQENYYAEMAGFFHDRELDEAGVREFLFALYDKALEVEEEDMEKTGQSLFYQPVFKDKIARVLGNSHDLLWATGFGTGYFLLFGQKGFDGVKIIANLFAADYAAVIEMLSFPSKLSIVFLTGIASGALGFVCGLDTRAHCAKLYRHLQHHPEDALKVGLLFLASLLSATSVTAAALSITEKPNLFGLQTWGMGGLLF